MKKSIFLILTLTVASLALGGCFRKSIESSPPAHRPAQQVEPKPATDEPGIIEETHNMDGSQPEVVEETHQVESAKPQVIDESVDVDTPDEVDAPAEAAATTPDVGGKDLAEEAPAAPQAVEATEKPVAEAVATEQPKAVENVTDPENEQVMDTEEMVEEASAATIAETGPFYVQVGAFSDLENANMVLASLLSDGYKGSVLSKSDTGMYRVRAGAFSDKAGAEKALEELRANYPNGYVLKAE